MLTLIICVLVFLAVAALVGGVAMMVRGGDDSAVTDRLAALTNRAAGKTTDETQKSVLSQPLDDRPGVLEALFARFLNLRLFLEQGDLNVPPAKFLTICGGLALAGAAATIVLGAPWFLAPFAAAMLGVLPFGFAWWKRKSRLKRFGQQLPDALELVARALRAGHSLAAGFQLVGQEMLAPIGDEFSRVYEEQNLGIPLEEALEGMADRVPNLDLRFFATAVIIQRQSGGDLAEILDKIGHLVRERFKIWGQVQALTGEGRLSGIVLLALPPVLFITMYRLNPGYVTMLFEDPMGKQMLFAALVLQGIGALVIRKIVNIRV
ncbi:MAG: type II secretion system F family protein [Planctomycetales bacterium]|nr:type II secretion system F family protein [Planctomycetales bacterium]